MRRSVDEFRRSAKDVESRLDMLQWKVETLSINSFGNNLPKSSQQEPISISQLLKDFSEVKNSFDNIKRELKEVLEQKNQTCNQLNEHMDSVKERFSRLKVVVGDGPE